MSENIYNVRRSYNTINSLQRHAIDILVSMTHIFDSSYFLFESSLNTPYRGFSQQMCLALSVGFLEFEIIIAAVLSHNNFVGPCIEIYYAT